MENVVNALFETEAEAYKAFIELRQAPAGTNYVVAEAALLTRRGDAVTVVESFDAVGATTDDTATGAIIGAVVGILGGPLGALLGAGAGALIGNSFDTSDAIDSMSMLEIMAAKLYDGDTAIIALVQEEEPAFDAAFSGYQVTITRRFAVDVLDEVDLARQATADFERQVRGQLQAERKAEQAAAIEERKDALAKKHAERKAKLQAHFDKIKAEHIERKQNFEEGRDIAEAQFTSSTQEMLGKN